MMDELQRRPGSGNGGLSNGKTLDTFRTAPGSWFHGMASASAGAFGPATMQGRRMNTSSAEPVVISARAASHAAFCSE